MIGAVFAATLLWPALADANNSPAPQALLGEMLIPIAMMICTAIGGGYAIMRRKKRRRLRGVRFVAGFAMVVVSLFFSESAIVLTSVFVILAVARGVQMIAWGVKAARPIEQRKPELERASARRLLPAGALLLALTTILVSWISAMSGWYFYTMADSEIQGELKKLLVHQFQYADEQRRQHGVARFEPPILDGFPGGITFENVDFNFPPVGLRYKCAANFFLGPGGRTFKVLVVPQQFPLFPWRYVVTRPSFYADQTGKIRAIQVHAPRPCPPDAPVVEQVAADAP
jgi:hypothetical protein